MLNPLDVDIAMNHFRSIFCEALERPADARAAYLEEACGPDAELRSRIEALLAAYDEAGGFLQDASPADGATEAMPPSTEFAGAMFAGTMIGPYKLLQRIGEGGMGVVYMAEQQQPVRRRVALKIIKPGMDTREVISRFEAERQALALMDHPNIAKILDAGVVGVEARSQGSGGRDQGSEVREQQSNGPKDSLTPGSCLLTSGVCPYFVMELVKGVPITQYCDEHHLTLRERLELFVPVCHAVQHAHQKGVIHRDLKSSNVLVAEYDHTAVPKIIDFGVAKAIGQRLTEKTIFTQFGHVVGTIDYMSPEQAKLNQLDIDTRTDVYSLGVLLYELLTGETPFDRARLHSRAFDEMLRIIREEEPPKPSTRLGSSQSLPAVAANRHTEPKKLKSLVRGELDWIVMKALEKDRNRRYETASALAADVQRYLHDEPVLACPPSAWYRFRKLARQNKRVAVMASFVLALLLVAVAVLGVSHARVQEALQGKSLALDREKETTYLQRTELSGRELAAGNVSRAEELLEGCAEHLRGWEWHFLKRQRYGNPPGLQHPETVTRVAFSPNGRQIASACMDGTLRIWDGQMGRVLHALLPEPVRARTHKLGGGMAYSPDGRYLAVARHDGLRIWDPTSGELLHTLKARQGPSWQVAFSPDSRTLASCGSDRSLRLWDVASGKELHVFSEHPAVIKAVAFRADGRSVLAACEDGTVKVWDMGTRQETFSFCGQLLAWPERACFSPDARRLAWSCLDGVIKVWDTTTGRLEIDQPSNTHQCRAIAFHPDGKRIALAGFDGTLRLLDAVSGREMLTIFAHPSLVADAVFSHDGNKIASASYDHTVRIWDATPLDGDPQAAYCVTLPGHKQLVSGVAFSPDGQWLASSSWDGTVKVWKCGTELIPFYTPEQSLSAIPCVATAGISVALRFPPTSELSLRAVGTRPSSSGTLRPRWETP